MLKKQKVTRDQVAIAMLKAALNKAYVAGLAENMTTHTDGSLLRKSTEYAINVIMGEVNDITNSTSFAMALTSHRAVKEILLNSIKTSDLDKENSSTLNWATKLTYDDYRFSKSYKEYTRYRNPMDYTLDIPYSQEEEETCQKWITHVWTILLSEAALTAKAFNDRVAQTNKPIFFSRVIRPEPLHSSFRIEAHNKGYIEPEKAARSFDSRHTPVFYAGAKSLVIAVDDTSGDNNIHAYRINSRDSIQVADVMLSDSAYLDLAQEWADFMGDVQGLPKEKFLDRMFDCKMLSKFIKFMDFYMVDVLQSKGYVIEKAEFTTDDEFNKFIQESMNDEN